MQRAGWIRKKTDGGQKNPVLQNNREIRTCYEPDSLFHRMMQFQRTIGNQAVQGLFKSGILQAKLRIGQPGDVYEQKADRIVEEVMRMPGPKCPECSEKEEKEKQITPKPLFSQITPVVQRWVEPHEEEEEENLKPKAYAIQTPEISSNIESKINAIKASGYPLPDSNRAFFESRFGYDSNRLQVHTDARSNALYLDRVDEARVNLERFKRKVWTCPPLSDSYANIRATTGEEGLQGYTKIDKSSSLSCAPKFEKSKGKERAGCTFKSVAVSLVTTSKYAKVEEFLSSGKMKLPECGEKEVLIYFKITKDVEMLAKAGEQEHCDDLSLAFHQTVNPCAEAVNKYAGTRLVGKDEDECYKGLVAKLGFDPISCIEEFISLAGKTDERDLKGWHTFDPKLISKDCTKIIVGFEKAKTNKIGEAGVAPAKYIPSATKCGGKKP